MVQSHYKCNLISPSICCQQRSLYSYILAADRSLKFSLFGILYGQPKAHLRVILEVSKHTVDANTDLQRYVYVSDWRPVYDEVGGESAWTTSHGQQIHDFFDEAIVALISLWQNTAVARLDSSASNYTITGGSAIQRGVGRVIDKSNQRITIRPTKIP